MPPRPHSGRPPVGDPHTAVPYTAVPYGRSGRRPRTRGGGPGRPLRLDPPDRESRTQC